MKYFTLALILIVTDLLVAEAQEAKLISDCTVTYNVSVDDAKADPQVIKSMEGSTKVLFLKGSKSRTDFITPSFKQTTIYDAKSDSTVILRELGNTKYISYLDVNKKKQQNRKFEGITFNKTNEKKIILGYDCEKVVAKLADGSSFNVFYSPGIIPSNKEYEYQFRDLPGFVLEYEALTEDGKTKIKYAASQITLVPVPVAKFDIPTTGYRVL